MSICCGLLPTNGNCRRDPRAYGSPGCSCQIPLSGSHIATLPEQAAIARFLDYIDRRIRRYIRAKRKLIALLEEQKQAIIQRAVTRGLDPNVRLKPSGVEWLGEIPEHWEMRKLETLGSSIGRGIAKAESRRREFPRFLTVISTTRYGVETAQ